ncbi:MAG: hypothetical protein CMP49_02405 [Flavobacteriales bacterium]|jgi:hypothetical protein|nr:hypothetical protein [Flavobacteriales bacterium]|tara:strand:+ start:14715 stop:15350 length:636 start_codon:yes stop_codon:yes gene_type:complete
MNFANSKFYKWLMPYLYGWGASLVIAGALFKILHWQFANEMLMVGMGTEALIFFMSAFEKAPKEYKWERAYPGILDAGDIDDDKSVTQQLDQMFEDANVDKKTIKNLADGMKKLSQSASGLGDVADGTKKYNTQMLTASESLEKINDLYMEQIKSSEQQFTATKKMTSNLTSSLDHTARLHVELSSLSENLKALNNVYGSMLNAMTNPKKK